MNKQSISRLEKIVFNGIQIGSSKVNESRTRCCVLQSSDRILLYYSRIKHVKLHISYSDYYSIRIPKIIRINDINK